MIDIEFYMLVHQLKQAIMSGERPDREFVRDEFERFRSPEPVVFNIETTNACNMKCAMCPRTTMMTRKVETLGMDVFDRIVSQLKPFTKEQWHLWRDFAEQNYGIDHGDMSENHFFLYILPKVVVLHGFGDPLLDKHMPRRIRTLAEKGFETYFSCNPANIDIDTSVEMFRNGLNYVKYSIDSVDDIEHKKIRGEASDFTHSYRKILRLIEEKEKHGCATQLIITMINLDDEDRLWQFDRLKEAFDGLDVYIYLKSLDQQWYLDKKTQMGSIHWLEFCQFPWSSMTIKSNGAVAMCGQDYNNEIILGDARTESLYDIWNGAKYADFRRRHIDCDCATRCTDRCDMKTLGQLLAAPVAANSK